jgi:hypothetical protein
MGGKMKKIIFLLFVFVSAFAQINIKRDYLIQIKEINLEGLKNLGIKFEDYNLDRVLIFYDNHVVMLASKDEIDYYSQKGYNVEILMQDTVKLNLLKRAYYGETLKLPDCYHTYNEIISLVDNLSRSYPKLIKKIIIGKTTKDKRNIYAVKISNNVNIEQDKPGILINACHHSDEILGAEISTELIKLLINQYKKNDEVTKWVDSYEIYIVPVINVDGHYIVTSSQNPVWRKNARDVNHNNILDSLDGVDLNRNYDFNWAFGGSEEVGSERYKGEYPFSESENNAIRNLLNKKKFVLSISYHSQGEVIYYPWNWKDRFAPDDSLLTEIATGLASSIKTFNGDTTYKAERGAGTVGQSYTYFYGKYGVFDFIIETGKGTHIYPCEGRENVVKSNLEGVKYILRKGFGPGLTGNIKDAKTGKPLSAIVWIPSIESEDISRRVSDSKFGRYYRLLRPNKKYNLFFMKEGYEVKIIKDVYIKKDGWTTLNVELNPLKK